QNLIASDTPQTPIENWDIAKRIVCYNNMKNSLVLIKNHPDVKSIKRNINSSIHDLNGQIEELKEFALSNIRLPFKIGPDRDNYYSKVKQGLKLIDTAKLHYVEREFFHLMSHHLPLTDIDTKLYESSTPLQSLKSWKSILKQYISES